jgi:formylglycine-generating enzyme required for sulfatase activity
MKALRFPVLLTFVLLWVYVRALAQSPADKVAPFSATVTASNDPSSPAPAKILTNSIGMRLVLVPAGEFVMGSPKSEKGSSAQERPQHRVRISRPFYLGQYEVTQGDYTHVMGRNPSQFKDVAGLDSKRLPVESVNWEDAAEFCRRLSGLAAELKVGRVYRLPTEAEWEYACRAGSTTAFHHGESLSSTEANFNGEHPYGGAKRGPYLQRPAVVGSYKPNAFGLYDMHGNVSEWCADWYDKDYYKNAPAMDPAGPKEGALTVPVRVLRGGSWSSISKVCRSSERFYDQDTRRYPDYGFRVACAVGGSELSKD